MKRKILISICLLIFSLQIKAQDHKFYLGIMSSMDYYKFQRDDYSITSSNDTYLGYHLGIKAQYDINKKFSLRSGIDYSKIVIKFDYTGFLPIDAADPLLMNDPKNTIDKSYFLHIPLMAGYTIYKKGGFRFTPSFGYILNIKLTSRVNTTLITYDAQKNAYIETPQFTVYNNLLTYHSLQLNLGCEYMLGKKYLITFEPYLNYIIDKNNSYLNILSSPFTFGGIVSVNYRL